MSADSGDYATSRTTLERRIALSRELLRREEARGDRFLPYCHFVTPWFQSPLHVQYTAPFFEAVDLGIIDRLMIRKPPRHGKTSDGIHFLSRYMGRWKREEIVLGSYNGKIAHYFGGKVRGVIERPQY